MIGPSVEAHFHRFPLKLIVICAFLAYLMMDKGHELILGSSHYNYLDTLGHAQCLTTY